MSKNLKVALVHDYLNEFGGAERVLLALAEMYPQAPIYTAFYREGSPGYERFSHRDVRASWAQKVPFFSTKLHSPLRFLAPLIWESFNFDEFDVVITSASWYITKGVLTRPETVNICYCHTPPRYLYGYKTSIELQKYWPVRVYANLVNPMMRKYDYMAAQRVDYFVANSQNVKRRIEKFYRRSAEVIYPPVSLSTKSEIRNPKKREYFLVISRIVGGKGLQLVVESASKLGVNLKVVGTPGGWSREYEAIQKLAGPKVEFLGYVPDEELVQLYAGAKAFLALAEDEDFGITPVEAQMCGTPVIAYHGGGYVESVVEGKTGVFVDELSVAAVTEAMKKIEKMKFKTSEIKKNAQRFSKVRFEKQMRAFVNSKLKTKK